MKTYTKVYEIYEKGKLIARGTSIECADALGVTKQRIYAYYHATRKGEKTRRTAKMANVQREYAIYKGDEYLFSDTKENCLKRMNVTEATFDFYTSNAARERNESGTVAVDLGFWEKEDIS